MDALVHRIRCSDLTLAGHVAYMTGGTVHVVTHPVALHKHGVPTQIKPYAEILRRLYHYAGGGLVTFTISPCGDTEGSKPSTHAARLVVKYVATTCVRPIG